MAIGSDRLFQNGLEWSLHVCDGAVWLLKNGAELTVSGNLIVKELIPVVFSQLRNIIFEIGGDCCRRIPAHCQRL